LKINLKLKTKLKTEILVILITLSIASIININDNFSNANQEVDTLNTSAPITPKYKYIYETDFDYVNHETHLPTIHPSVLSEDLIGDDTEWSQDPTDADNLQLGYTGGLNPWEGKFFMNGIIVIESHNTFEKPLDPNLGVYIDWSIDLDIISVGIDLGSIQSYISISIVKPTVIEELITIEDLNLQEGTFYLANFKEYIWDDGKIRFTLSGYISGSTIWSFPNPLIYASINFKGLRVVQEINPVKPEAEKRTLILVHGFSFEKTYPMFWLTYLISPEFQQYYDKLIVISYLGDYCVYKWSKDEDGVWHEDDIYDLDVIDTNVWTTINELAVGLAQYIMQDYDYVGDNVDIICHSMGGLVTRYMIKNYYTIIQTHYNTLGRDFKIQNVCAVATPNHGVWYNWIAQVITCSQIVEMSPGSLFLNELNNDGVYFNTEIPLSGIYINWFTYRSGIFEELGIRNDGVVEATSVPLNGANNKGLYNLDHAEMIFSNSRMMNHVIFNDIFKPPEIVQTIFDEGTPGIIMQIEDLTLQPNYDAPGGKTLLSITLPAEDAVDIDSTTVTLYVSTYNYQMTLKAGTTDTYEVELPLTEGNYSFLITADELILDGWLYQMSGNLIIIDDDVNPPVIQLTPVVLSISDEDAVGGTLISWNISDYSGISEANVLLNGVEIRSYTNQGTIIDSYVLPNEPGVYNFSVWARDNDDDLAHDPPGEDWSEYSIERIITIYDDDLNLPEIQITPVVLSISDEDAVGGTLISWNISDYSGISEANVLLNGVEIRSYTNQGTIIDSYVLPNEPGVYNFSVWAKDNDNDLEDDWLEYSTERTITIYDDDLNPPEIEITPGDLTISVEEAEGGVLISWEISDYSGISEANILLNGIEIQSYANQGTIIDSYLLANEPGVYNFSIWAKDNDNDLEDDWLEYSTKITITIYEEDDIPPPAIPGYSVSVLLGILSVVIILISKKRRNYKI